MMGYDGAFRFLLTTILHSTIINMNQLVGAITVCGLVGRYNYIDIRLCYSPFMTRFNNTCRNVCY